MYLKAVVLFFIGTLNLFALEGYYLVEQYLQKYPSQKKISDRFENIVSSQSNPIHTKQQKLVKIVMIYPGNQISDYWRRSKDSFEKRLIELGITYTLEDHFTKPGEVATQAKQILEAIQEDTDYLIFTLDANKHKKFISKILSLKKPKLILQNITTPLKAWGEKQPFIYVGFDHVIGSKMIADFYLEKFPKDKNYIVLYGPEGYVSDMRGKEFISYIKTHSNNKLLDAYFTDFDKEKAYNATKDAIKRHHDKIDFIYACSTDIALGAIEALKDANLSEKIAINGWGGGEKELEMVEKGYMDTTVMRMNDDNGVAMAEAIKLDLEDKKSDIPLIFSGDFKLIKKGISKEELDSYKSWAFRYSK